MSRKIIYNFTNSQSIWPPEDVSNSPSSNYNLMRFYDLCAEIAFNGTSPLSFLYHKKPGWKKKLTMVRDKKYAIKGNIVKNKIAREKFWPLQQEANILSVFRHRCVLVFHPKRRKAKRKNKVEKYRHKTSRPSITLFPPKRRPIP